AGLHVVKGEQLPGDVRRVPVIEADLPGLRGEEDVLDVTVLRVRLEAGGGRFDEARPLARRKVLAPWVRDPGAAGLGVLNDRPGLVAGGARDEDDGHYNPG